MAEFNQTISTNAGLDLFTNIIANTDKLQFTKIITSTNIYPENQIPELTSLSNTKQTVLISNITKQTGNKVKIQAVVSNETLTEAYTINSIGIYAKDTSGTEILYAVATVESEGKGAYMPVYNNITVARCRF